MKNAHPAISPILISKIGSSEKNHPQGQEERSPEYGNVLPQNPYYEERWLQLIGLPVCEPWENGTGALIYLRLGPIAGLDHECNKEREWLI